MTVAITWLVFQMMPFQDSTSEKKTTHTHNIFFPAALSLSYSFHVSVPNWQQDQKGW